MKKKLLFLSIVLITLIAFSCKKNLLTTDPYVRGGGGTDMGAPPQPRPTGFKRNNGNGTCNGSAQIRVSFDTCPSYAPILEAIYQPSSTSLGNALSNFTFDQKFSSLTPSTNGDLAPCSNNNKYVSYCIFGLGGASTGNIPPANTLVLQFFYPTTGQVFFINNEGDPYYQ